MDRLYQGTEFQRFLCAQYFLSGSSRHLGLVEKSFEVITSIKDINYAISVASSLSWDTLQNFLKYYVALVGLKTKQEYFH